jgi:predicted acyltransferase
LDTRGLIAALLGCLIGYWLMLLFIPVPGIGAGIFDEGKNLTNYLDSIWLPGKKYDGDHDPEGLLSTIPAIGTALLGMLAGQWLKRDLPPMRKVTGLIVAGAALLLLGWCWHPFFPVVKKLWSSSFVLVAGGWAAMLLGVFYWIIDVKGLRSWCQPFIWVGTNPLSLYLMSGLGVFSALSKCSMTIFKSMSERIIGHHEPDWTWPNGWVVFALMLLTARYMYKRGIILKA